MDEVSYLNQLVAVLAGELADAWRAGSPGCRKRFKRQSDPRPGDMVVETSTHYNINGCHPWSARHSYGDRVGRLLAIAIEPIDTDPDDWGDEPLPTEAVYYIALSDGRVHRWVNASFAAVPDSPGGLDP